MIKDVGFENIKPIHIDVAAYLKACNVTYDFIFADPPYDLKWFAEVPEMVLASGILKNGGLFVMEHPRDMDFCDIEYFIERRNYGGVNFSFFIKE